MSCSSIFRSHCLSVELRSISYREGSAIRNLLAPRTGGLSASAYRGLSTKCFIGANRIGPLPEREPTAYTLITTVSCFEWAPRPSQRGFGFCTTSVGQAGQGVAMAIGKARRRAVDSPKIRSRTRCELTLVVILSTDNFPFSIDAGPILSCMWARHGISGGAISCHRIRVRFAAAGPQLYASSVNFRTHSGSHSQH